MSAPTAASERRVLLLHPADNVAIATTALPAQTVHSLPDGRTVTVRETIPFGHKLAVTPIAPGAEVRKYGQVIGYASRAIGPGEWVHVHNVRAGELAVECTFATDVPPPPPPIEGRTFLGFRRPDGRAATRNYIGIISTVNCSATASKYVAAHFDPDVLAEYSNIDGVVALTHKGGCAMEFDGPDHRQLARTLAGFARHPNIGAYLVIGLGCETAQPSYLVDRFDLVPLHVPGRSPDTGPQPLVMTIQEQGGIRKTVDRAVGILKEMLPEVNRVQREPIPASELILATECGGSDGNSGITANPALGVAADMLVAAGGTVILAETPEIAGGEHLLTRRAVSEEVGRKLLERIEWWKWYAGVFGTVIDNNPSVGNKAGGLTTIYEKSLGAIAKGGSTALRAVYEYAEPVTEKGLVVMDTPGFDAASVTGMVAGGANVVAFTTGRGSCFGCKPVPSIKIATNTPMYERMRDDMDINAGRILEGVSVEEVGREIFEYILAVASGQKTKSELQGMGDEEFCPWVYGPVL
ncbi:MAG: altronate dehydratase [Planctomycetota bacterium]|nr:MAG: altronate dehydratase [Planctomycetota bacterium]